MAQAPSLATLAIHAGREDFAELGVHAPPIDLSTTYPVSGLEAATASLDAMAMGGRPKSGEAVYGRLHNPTVARFEEALARLEGQGVDAPVEAVAFASGMAATTACLLAARELGLGHHVVATRPIYGGTDHLLSGGLLDFDTTWSEPGAVPEALRDDTALVITETPANPSLRLVDVDALVRSAAGIPVLVDSTFATPVLQRPLAQGATLVLHSATKYLGGHGDVIAGVVATADLRWAAALRRIRVATGALLHPLAAYLLHRGLATLPLRVGAAQASADALARRLAEHPDVGWVGYPGLPGGDPDGLLGRQMSGPGSMIAFEVRGGFGAARRLVEGLRWITTAVSLGSVDSLIQHPAALTHRVVSEDGLREGGITPSLLRLAVGLEHVEDLWGDLDGALRRTHRRIETPRRAAPVLATV
ncbi:MAG: PLP-dependent transferase [Acidobacteriota bacterium]